MVHLWTAFRYIFEFFSANKPSIEDSDIRVEESRENHSEEAITQTEQTLDEFHLINPHFDNEENNNHYRDLFCVEPFRIEEMKRNYVRTNSKRFVIGDDDLESSVQIPEVTVTETADETSMNAWTKQNVDGRLSVKPTLT